jgi:hypothetical protein
VSAAAAKELAVGSLPRLEFTLATFGVSVDTAAVSGLPVAGASPPQGCGRLDASGGLTFEEHLALTNATAAALLDAATRARNEARLAGSAYGGKVVVLQRGGCSFIDKAKSAQAAGAAAVAIANSATHLSRFGVEPRWKGLGVHVPVLMVTDLGGAALLAAATRGGAARFTLSAQVGGLRSFSLSLSLKLDPLPHPWYNSHRDLSISAASHSLFPCNALLTPPPPKSAPLFFGVVAVR